MPSPRIDKQALFQLAGFVLVVVGAGLAIGATNLPGAWYQALHKPSFNPPPWIFPPTWTILYGLIAVAGWRLYRCAPRSLAMRLWIAQIALNFLWSPIVFRAHALTGGMIVIGLLDLCLVATVGSAWRKDRLASVLLLPYLAWVLFASILNGALVALN